MRILHMSSEGGWRGGEQQIAYLLQDLFDKGVQNVLAIKGNSKLADHCQEKKIPYYPVTFSNSLDAVSAWEIRRICKKEKIDLIHLHSSKAQGVGVLSALFGNKVPMVLSRRVAFSPGRNMLSRWKYNHDQIKKILCVSERIRTIMNKYLDDGSKCVTVYSGIDLNKFSKTEPDRRFITETFQLDDNKTIIANIGAIDTSKDHITFVDTLERVVRVGHAVQGLIIGDGPLANALKSYVKEKGLDHAIKFAGYRKDVGRILVSVDMFLMTSREEGLGTSLLDAFLARIPVVATDAGGIPEIVKDMDTGLLAPVRDAVKLSQNVIRLLNETSLRDRLIKQASVFVRNFSREETSCKTWGVYQEVLRQGI